MKRDFLTVYDLSSQEIISVIRRAIELGLGVSSENDYTVLTG